MLCVVYIELGLKPSQASTAMPERLTGERLIEKVREITGSSEDDRALKSRICVGCGYVHDNGLPDFVGFYNALKEAKKEINSSDDKPQSLEDTQRNLGEIRDEIRQYAEYLSDTEQDYTEKLLEQSKADWKKFDRQEFRGKVIKKISSLFGSKLGLRLRFAKATGIDILLTDESLLELARFYDEQDLDDRELKILSKILERSPNNQKALIRRAITLQCVFEEYEKAIRDWTQLLEAGTSKRWLMDRAECYLELNELAKAEEDALEVFNFRPSNYTAKGAYAVLSKIESSRGNQAESERYANLAEELDTLDPELRYKDPEREFTYKIDGFDQSWQEFRRTHYAGLKALKDFPLDIDSFIESARSLVQQMDEGEIEDWAIEALCLCAIDELWKIPFISEDQDNENLALRHKVENTIRHFIANTRRSWAERYTAIAIQVVAEARSSFKKTDLSTEQQEAHKLLVHSVLKDVYREITNECESHIETMDQVVKLAKMKSPFADRPDPVLRKADIEDGRLSAYWEEGIESPGLDLALGKSLVYLVDFEGDAYIPKFEDTMTFSETGKLPYIAATIIQDIYGDYDRENTVALIEAINHFGPIAENAESIEEIFDSVKEAAEEDGFFELTETTDTLKAFLTAIPEDPALEELLRAVKNPLQIIQIAEKHGFQGLTPDALEKAWFGEPIVPKYLFHHFKRRGADKSTSMLLYEAQGALVNAMKRGDEEKVIEARKQVVELEQIMKMDSSEWTKQHLKKRLTD